MQSFKAFEKTTLLIGKEMEDTKRMIREFTNELNGFFERNRKIFEQEDRIKSIESYILILKDIENSESQIDEEIKNFEDEFEQFKEAKLNLETNLESIEKSKEHERDMEKKRKRGEELKEVERQIEITKSQIDIKKLARQFYKNPANNALLKNYSNNFLSGLRGDEELRIIEIVDSGQNLDVSELRGLRERLIELEIPLITGSDEKIESIEKELKILESKIAVMNSNREIEVKKKERVKERKERLLGEISKEAEEVFPGVKLTFTSRN